jgi:cytochrome c oxidase accessory protein FixG
MRLDKAPMSVGKAAKKIAKHAVWLLIAAATGGAWVFYFGNAPTLARDLFTGRADAMVYVFVGLLTFTTYALAGTMREQVCTFMCPWPRIQAAMTDEYALSVTYRGDRGEPRGPHKKGASWEGRGDCIDCNQCVAACPQGIDIRDGDQLECINCALCIDACDTIMKRVGRPTGLIAYDTHANVDRRKRGESPLFRFLRPRTLLYGGVMLLVGAIMLYQLVNRATLNLDVIRDRSPEFVRLADGSVRNDYNIKIINRAPHARQIAISMRDLPGARLSVQDVAPDAHGRVVLPAAADDVTDARVHVVAPPGLDAGLHPFHFDLRDVESGETADSASSFVSGAP